MENLEEKVLWCAMKYALCLEEGDAVEAVMHTLRPKISELSDKTLYDMLTAVEAVRTLASGSHEKKNVWAVNTEEEYHEGKTEKK